MESHNLAVVPLQGSAAAQNETCIVENRVANDTITHFYSSDQNIGNRFIKMLNRIELQVLWF